MTPQELKNSILQLAIQGRLVEQRPEEGTGEELYQQIQAEKQALIKAGKIKKDRRTAALETPSLDIIPFDIPETWKWVYLGSILNKLTDGTHRTPKYSTSGVKFVSVKDMSTGVLFLDNTKFITASEHEELFSRCDPERGDMLLSKVGTTGVPAIVNTDEPFSLFVSVALLKYNHCCIDEAFLYYLLKSPLVQLQATENTRGVGNKNWVLDAIAATVVVLPPLAEQKRIVAKLEELLPLIDRYEKAWSRLEDFNKRFPGDMQKSILQLAIQGRLVPQSNQDTKVDLSGYKRKETEEVEFDLPDNWLVAHLECITDTIPSKNYQILESQVLKDGLYPVISQSKEYSIGYSNDETKLFHHSNPVIVFGDHTTEIKCVDFNFVVGADGVKIFAPKACLYPKFFYYEMQYLCIDLNKIGGYSRHYKYIKNKPILLPPLAEQKRIVAKLEELLPLCERLK